jgi:hypothetical protein
VKCRETTRSIKSRERYLNLYKYEGSSCDDVVWMPYFASE